MDKKDYLNTLKNINLQPKKIRVEQREKEEVLLENKSQEHKVKFLNELFVQLADAEKVAAGPSRDAQLLRLGIIAELDAANFYETMASLADSEDLKTIMLDIAYEEKVHVGEFHKLLVAIDPETSPSDKEGEDEVEEKTE